MKFSKLFVPVLVTVILAIGIVAGFSAPANAHNSLVSSTPEAGSTITELPEAFSITTNEDLFAGGADSGGFALQVVGPDGLYYGDGCVETSGATMSAAPALGPAGDYTLTWQVVSVDGHPVSDQFTFTWAPTSDAEISTGSPTAPVCGEPAEPEPTESTESPTPAPEATEAPDLAEDRTDNTLSTTLWIGGIVVALAAAAIAAFLLTGRKKKS